ncbi:MAG: hypothetical protein ACLU4B_04095 [Bilophila wadsworthia]
MRIFVFLGTILVIFILFTGHVLLVTKDAPDDSYLPSLESSISMLSPMTAMPQLFTPKEQTWIDEHPVITVRMTPAFIPLSDSKQLNAYAGISLDYLRLLSRIIGIQFRIEPQSNWTTALEDAKQWRTDLFAMVEPTLAVDANLLLTRPHISLPGIIVIHENAQHATSLKELAGKRVSVVYRHYWHNYLESRYPDIILTLSAIPAGAVQVMSGHSDALVDYKASVLLSWRQHASAASGDLDHPRPERPVHRRALGLARAAQHPLQSPVPDPASRAGTHQQPLAQPPAVAPPSPAHILDQPARH